ncbi:MAG: Tad domain-containing protein [Candidatus Omnitrophica bacterium]|nr:Tad domain-containing protein [Candidatus Omnitrophota bacterium]
MNFFRKNLPTNRRSQIAVIITFVIAVIFLFMAVFINLSKVSQVKTTTSTAADKAALSLASQLGSMSHYYKDKVLGGQTEKTGYGWLALMLVLVGSIVGGILISPVVLLTGLGLLVSMSMSTSMLEGISDRFNKEMTTYTALRESALFGALLSTQSDDVELKRVGAGIFRDEVTGKDYDLSAIPEMRNANKVGRFAAWYYALRQPLVSDDDLKEALDKFKNGLKRFIAIDEWDNTKWKISRLSYFIEPVPAQNSANYEITCTSCPAWVKDIAHKQIAIMKIDATQPDGPSQITGGFLKDKFLSLLSRLSYAYGLTFCSKPETFTQTAICDDVVKLMEDLRMFLFRSKELVDTPMTEALNSTTQWLPFFYDSAQHNLDKSSIDGDLEDDAYERLTRDQNTINSWITELEKLNNTTIKPEIINNHGGYCEQGRPDSDVVSNCFTALESCYCWHTECGEYSCWKVCDGSKCKTSLPARWHGNYGTCTGSGFNHTTHPVCQKGDLYQAQPDYLGSNWCNKLRSVPCVSHNDSCDQCSPPPTSTVMDNSYNFQGQMSWENTSGPTEVEQALKILRALNYDIGSIKKSIEEYVDAQIKHLTPTCLPGLPCALKIRNEIVYAWKDKPKSDGSQQFSHFVQVAIEGYPEKLPYISETVKWLGQKKTWKLENAAGDLKIMVRRYDQDQPTDVGKTDKGWELKRRKTPGAEEFSPKQLEDIVADIQADGKIDSTQNSVDSILGYAITSCSKAHYGPEKRDIYISGTKCE